MNNAITNYQTSFRVVDTDGEALKRLKGNVYGWMLKKEKDRRFSEEACDFFFRCNWQNLFETYSSLTTNTFRSDAGDAWAMHYTEVDKGLGRKRFWYSDIGFRKEGTDVVVSVRVSYAWNSEDLSGHQVEPEPTVPAVVRYLLSGSTGYSGKTEFRLIEEPARFKDPGMGQALAGFIKSPERRYSLIVFNGDTPELEQEARLLAFKLTGKAQVAMMSRNAELEEEFEHYMGMEYDVPAGFFRVFFPFKARNSSERHRWYDIQHPGYATQRPGIIRGILRYHNLAEKGAVETVADITRLISRETLLKLAKDNPEHRKEWEQFTGLYTDLEKERDQLKSDADHYVQQIDELEREKGELNYKIQGIKARFKEAQNEAGVNLAQLLPTLPETLAEVASMAAQHIPRLVITENALKAAEDYKECKCVREAWEMLVYLSEVLHPLKFQEGEKNLEGKFREETGYELAMSEGKMTKDDSKLMRLRKIQHDGREYDITPHVKHGNQEPKLVRIHIAFDEEKKKIVVGRIGRHLDNYTTKKM